MNERVKEFMDHFGTKDLVNKFYLCTEDVPFDNTQFYDFEEKKFYFMVSNLDYCRELES